MMRASLGNEGAGMYTFTKERWIWETLTMRRNRDGDMVHPEREMATLTKGDKEMATWST